MSRGGYTTTQGRQWLVQVAFKRGRESRSRMAAGVRNRLTVWVREHSTRATDSRQIYRGPGIYLDGTPIKRKMDVGFTAGHRQSGADNTNTNASTDTRKRNWSEILVTGELKSNPDQDGQEEAWVDLATYAREVFRT